MSNLINYIKRFTAFCAGMFTKRPKQPKARRRERIKTLWPEIRGKVETWEKAFSDKRVQAETKRYYGLRGEDILGEIYSSIPVWGAYCTTSGAEISAKLLQSMKIDLRASKSRSLSHVHIADRNVGGDDESMWNFGITVMSAHATSEIPRGFYAMDSGYLYTVKISHWSESKGHFLGDYRIVITNDGSVKPLYYYATEHQSIKSKNRQGYTRIPSSSWKPMCNNLDCIRFIVAAFNLSLERNFYWNCLVSSDGVPPIAFPVLDDDIARIFPKRQRNGAGKIVHWTRTHQRKTRAGVTSVRTHIRGNPEWEVDGKSVKITMPGKHHDCTNESVSVVTNKDDMLTVAVQGREYGVLSDKEMRNFVRGCRITDQRIELDSVAA